MLIKPCRHCNELISIIYNQNTDLTKKMKVLEVQTCLKTLSSLVFKNLTAILFSSMNSGKTHAFWGGGISSVSSMVIAPGERKKVKCALPLWELHPVDLHKLAHILI